jgi:plastocyanin
VKDRRVRWGSLRASLRERTSTWRSTLHARPRAPHFALVLILFAACSRPKPSAPVEKPVEFFHVDPATAGVVAGKVVFTGKAPAAKIIDMTEVPECAKQHPKAVEERTVAVNKNGTIGNVFVYIKKGLEGKTFEPPSTPAVMDQKGCWFEPRVLGLQVGQPFEVTNSDPVTHNIHPRAHENREWNQSQAPGTPPLERKFAREEVMIRVKCNVHSWMHAFLGVVDNPYFAVTGADGTFELKNVPPGEYTIEAWQEELGSAVQHVTVPASGKAQVEFTFKGE